MNAISKKVLIAMISISSACSSAFSDELINGGTLSPLRGAPGFGPVGPGGPLRPGHPGRPMPPPPGNYPGYNRQVRQIFIGRSVQNEVLPLRQLGGIDRQYEGWQVASVRAMTRPNSPYTTVAQLIVDNRVVSEQVNPGRQIYLIPQFQLVLGANAQTLRLGISGSTFIDMIEVELVQSGHGYPPGPVPPPPPRPPVPPAPPVRPQPPRPVPPGPPINPAPNETVAEFFVQQNIFGNSVVQIQQMVQPHQRGLRVNQVSLVGNALNGVAFVDVIVNGYVQATIQLNGGYMQTPTVYLNALPTLGSGEQFYLRTRGDVFLERIRLTGQRW